MEINEISVPGYERVAHATDDESGLNAIISVHSTALGPSLGGIRMLEYPSFDAALVDVVRLSKAMTYKAAIAETGQGGGKAVIIGDPATGKSEALFRAMGRFIEALDGAYIAAEDMNIAVEDLEIIAEETKWVSGLAVEHGSSGNPSPITAWGCFLAVEACLERRFGEIAWPSRKIAVQGVGAVGSAFVMLCRDAGASVVVADADRAKARRVAAACDCEVLDDDDPEAILEVACDVLAPCACGGVLNAQTIPRLNCPIVAGAANNQLAEPEDARRLADRGILYAPDYVVNAGGIINIAVEFRPEGYSESVARERCRSIPRALQEVFRRANDESITTDEAAERIARKRIESASSCR